MKIVGLFCLLIGSSLAGMMVANSLEKLLKDIISLKTGLQRISSQIAYQRTPLAEIMKALGGDLAGDVGGFFSLWATNIDKYHRPFLALLKTREELEGALNFPPDIWSCLKDLGRSLGATVSADQIKNIDLALDSLSRIELSLQQEVPKKAKLWRYAGVLGGVALAIVCL